MLTVNGTKMSKSLGNSFLPHELISGEHPLLEKGYSPMTVRFFFLQANYKSTVDFSNEALQGAEKGFNRLMNSLETLNEIAPSETSTVDVDSIIKKSIQSMNDDFNTPTAIAHLFDGVKIINSVKDKKEKLTSNDLEKLRKIFNIFVNEILGFNDNKEDKNNDLSNELIELILELRKNAKNNQDFDSADLIRDKLEVLGIDIKDNKDGSSWDLK